MTISKPFLLGVLVALLLTACASTGDRQTGSASLPQDMKIVPPDPTVPAQMAAFSGKWVGVWDAELEHILVVEEINPPNAIAIYAWGRSRSWRANPGFSRVQGQIKPGELKLTLGRPATVTYRLQANGTLDALYEWSGGVARATLKRMAP